MADVAPAGGPIAALRRLWRGRRPSAAVLVYHRVARAAWDPFGQAVDPATFERQLEIARRFGSVLSAPELAGRLARGESIARTITVTFDDGYVDNLTTAAPIAARLDVPITVFVAMEPVLDGTPFWWDQLAVAVLRADGASPEHREIAIGGDPPLPLRTSEERQDALQRLHAVMRRSSAGRRAAMLREIVAQLDGSSTDDSGRPMTADELRRLAALPGVHVGSHTMTHPSLAALDVEEQRAEMAESRQALERLLGAPARLMAYPFGKDGDVSAATRAASRSAGFDAAFTTMPFAVGMDADPFAIPRLTVHEWTADVFTQKLASLVGPPLR
ncbi:MAG TPA: polysaccharide deacetylase family protein [Gemmatimonadaceae bacterium]|nr:polysaccharide deacetylase family protein [Gemmatimonadaceae bacterium]